MLRHPHHPPSPPSQSLSSSSLLFFWFNPSYFSWFEQEGREEGWRWREAYYPSSSALNYLNANDVRGREVGGWRWGGGSRKVMMVGGRHQGEMGRSACLAGKDKTQRRGLICCCLGSPGAVWLFWKQVSWGENPESMCADPPCPIPGVQSTWSRLFIFTRAGLRHQHFWPCLRSFVPAFPQNFSPID